MIYFFLARKLSTRAKSAPRWARPDRPFPPVAIKRPFFSHFFIFPICGADHGSAIRWLDKNKARDIF
jgi:hypothetical protein